MPNFMSSRLIFQLFQTPLIHHLPFTKLTTANSLIIETSHTLESDIVWAHRKGEKDKRTTKAKQSSPKSVTVKVFSCNPPSQKTLS